MSSTGVKSKKLTKEDIAAEEAACAKTLVIAFDKFVVRNKQNLWEFVEEFIQQRVYYGFSFDRTASILRAAITTRNEIEWKGKTLDPEYTKTSSYLSKVVKVASYPMHDSFRQAGKSVHQAYDEILLIEKAERAEKMDLKGMQKRATKANAHLKEIANGRKGMKYKKEGDGNNKKKETIGWQAEPFDADRDWRVTTWNIAENEPRLFDNFMSRLSRKKPEVIVRMLRHIIHMQALPEGVIVRIKG